MSIIYLKKKKNKPRRKRSSYGTDRIDFMEQITSPFEGRSGRTLPQMVAILHQKYPDDPLYKSMLKKKDAEAFTSKQARKIRNDYQFKYLHA